MTTPTTTNNNNNKLPLTKEPIWTQQDGETDLLYSYFEIYRDMAPVIRSYDKLQQQLAEAGRNVTTKSLYTYGSDNQWQPRIEAHDKYMSQLTISNKEAAILEMVTRHSKISKDAIDVITATLMDPDLMSVDINKRPYLLDGCMRALDKAARLERLTLGESTSITKNENEGLTNLMLVYESAKKDLLKVKETKKKETEALDADYEIKD